MMFCVDKIFVFCLLKVLREKISCACGSKGNKCLPHYTVLLTINLLKLFKLLSEISVKLLSVNYAKLLSVIKVNLLSVI